MLTIEDRTRTMSDADRQTFAGDLQAIHGMLDVEREQCQIPEYDVTALLAEDFGAEVTRVLAESAGADGDEASRAPYSAERLGGQAVAKCIYQATDNSRVTIVFDAANGQREEDDRVFQIFLIAHELTHPLIDRARFASGATVDVIRPAATGTEIAQSLSRILSAEYWADRYAAGVVQDSATITVNGEQRPLRFWDVAGDL